MPNKTSYLITNLVGGEVSALMQGRTDAEIYRKSLEWCQNFLPMLEGGAAYRNGCELAGLTKDNAAASLIPFQFSINDAYMIVATSGKFRFYRNNGVVLDTAKNITGVTQANPAVVTSASHGYSNGDEVYIESVGGMTQVNRRFFKVAGVTTNTFQLQDQFGNAVNSTGYSAYTSGGTVSKIYELTTPYTSGGLDKLRYAQTADTMYIGSNDYEPRKLVRTGHTSWTIGTYLRVSDPFTASNKWPACYAFTIDSRMAYAGTLEFPEIIHESRINGSSGFGYDNFSASSTASDALVILLAPVANTIDAIQEMVQYNRQMVVLGSGSIRRIYGDSPDLPPNGTSKINAAPTFEGSAKVRPLVIGGALIFVDVSGKQLKELRFDQYQESYEARNLSILASQIGESALIRIVRAKGTTDTIWALRADGTLLSFAYSNRENAAGWARHYAGNGGLVEDIAVLRNSTGGDQLWMVVKRTINGVVQRSVEFMSAAPQWISERAFYTGDKTADKRKADNVNWELQKRANFLDAASRYDGRTRGQAASATITPSATTGASITLTASAAVFTAADVGSEVWKVYASDGSGGGMAEITGFTSSTVVTAKVLVDFDSTSAIAAGSWELAVKSLTGLHLYEGQSVDVVADGAYLGTKTVTAGGISLELAAAQIYVGYKYLGFMALHNVDTGGVIGPAALKIRNIDKATLKFFRTVSCKAGTSEYALIDVVLREPSHLLGRVNPPMSVAKELPMLDSWDYDKKQLVIVQDKPQPCTVLAMDLEVNTVDHT